MRGRKITRRIVILFFLILSLFILLPLLFMLVNSFMSTREVMQTYGSGGYTPLKLLPERLSLEQYYKALIANPEFYYYFWNTVALVLPSLLGTLVLSTIGAYGFSRFDFPGRRALYFVFIFLVIIPYQVMLSPQYIVMRETGLLGSRLSVILPLCTAPLGVFLLTGFMRGIPDDTLEAARLEGLREIQVFFHVAIPQAAPGIALLAMLTLVENWSLVEQPLVFLGDPMQYPLSIALTFIGSQRMEVIYACAVFFMIPVLLCFFLGVRSLVDNLIRIME